MGLDSSVRHIFIAPELADKTIVKSFFVSKKISRYVYGYSVYRYIMLQDF